MLCGLGDLVVETEMTSEVVVRFAELVVCEESAKGGVKRVDGLQNRCGVVVEGVLGLVETISDGDSSMCFLVARAVIAGNQE